jgi:predicted phosphodiesterase
MRVAALYDIHGNLPALEAVLAEPDVAAADRVVVGGDALEGPMPAETLALLVALGDRAAWVRGNTERELIERRGADPAEGELWDRRATWAAGRLTAEDLAFCGAWPLTASLTVDGLGAVCFCHATPRSDSEIFTAVSSAGRVAPMLAAAPESAVVCGHTHVQFDRAIGAKRAVNAGSVGMPYQGEPGAYWCLLGPDAELRRTDYDVEAAAERIRATGLPDAHGFAAALLRPPSAEEATTEFEAMARGRE